MLHVTAVRRPAGGLRKPSLSKPGTKTQLTTNVTPKVNQELQDRVILLESGQYDALKDEIVCSLNKGLITASECLQLFINTAWKDRNCQPIIARLFHNITQETEADFSLLIDSKCDNLLKVLTVLGKPTTSDLSMVTLLANLYHIEGLPVEHKEGLEMYLIDIAKAFWPYFMPEKNSSIWNDDICDCVCDVLMAIGKTLDEKCPINMERSFNNITVMMFSSCVISSYTLLRFLELKELRAANWCLTNTARSYYKSAYSKHDRSSSCSCNSKSPVPQPSMQDDDDVFNHQYKVTISNSHVKNGLKHPVVVKVQELEHNVNQDKDLMNCNQVHDAVVDDDQWASSYYSEETEKDMCGSKDIHLAEHTSCIDTSKDLKPDNTPYNRILTNECHETNVGLADQSILKGFHGNSDSNTCLLQAVNNPSCNSTIEENTGQSKPQGFPESTNPPDGFPCPGGRPLLQRTASENDSNCVSDATQFRPQGFPGTNNSQGGFPTGNCSFQRTLSENCDGSNAEQSRPPGFPGNCNSRGGFPSFPSNNSFQRTLSENDSNDYYDNNAGQFRPHGFPGSADSQGSFPRPRNSNGFQRGFSDSDGVVNSGGFPIIHRQNSIERTWKCMLEFPVEEENEHSDKDSRLYLLSFATRPVSLERPADLTMTDELIEQKPWLTGIILSEPKTILERFASLQSCLSLE